MILEQFYLGCLAQASYLIVDEQTGSALVVDPRRDVDVYLEAAARLGARIERVLLTHFHADFVSGHLELAAKTGARIGLGSAAEPAYTADRLADGERIELGQVRIEVLHTPGHTPESVCYLITDLATDPERPHAVLTGDTLFLGDVGRPDLMSSAGHSAGDLAGRLYDSIHGKLLPLHDELLVYPGHGAGSMCGKALSDDRVSTLGKQRATNPALAIATREEFIKQIAAGQPRVPGYFAHDAALNRSQRPTLEESLSKGAGALSLDDVLRLQEQGTVVLDVREPEEYSAHHLRGSLCVGLSGKFATFSGTVISPGEDIVLIGTDEQVAEAAVRLGRIGLDRVKGHLMGGFATAAQRPELLATVERIDPAQLLARSADPNRRPVVLDVRMPGEVEAGAIEGSVHVALPELSERLGELPRDREVVVVCRSGYRSAIGASLLERAGFDSLADLRGGMLAFEEQAAGTNRS